MEDKVAVYGAAKGERKGAVQPAKHPLEHESLRSSKVRANSAPPIGGAENCELKKA